MAMETTAGPQIDGKNPGFPAWFHRWPPGSFAPGPQLRGWENLWDWDRWDPWFLRSCPPCPSNFRDLLFVVPSSRSGTWIRDVPRRYIGGGYMGSSRGDPGLKHDRKSCRGVKAQSHIKLTVWKSKHLPWQAMARTYNYDPRKLGRSTW